jgi:hypothetical protein
MSLQHPYATSNPYPLPPGNPPPASEAMPRCVVQDGIRYELLVVQQPKRARMCGFGDKDRRPITPPPCVRLIITDVATGKEVDCKLVSPAIPWHQVLLTSSSDIDHAMYVLNVDLWSENGGGEVNLVRHSASTPAVTGNHTMPAYQMPLTQQQFIPSHGQGPISGLSSSPPGSSSTAYNPFPNQPHVNPYAQPEIQAPYPGHYASQVCENVTS